MWGPFATGVSSIRARSFVPMPVPESHAGSSDELSPESVQPAQMPLHGFQGDRGAASVPADGPASLTIAISREAGSRGGSIARRAAAKLGWQVYTQELLEYLAQEGSLRQDLLDAVSASGARWSAERLEQLLREQNLSQHPSIGNL